MKAKSFLITALLIAVSLPAIYQIITPGYFPIHDDTQVARINQMYKALSAGQFPVRWVPDLGYGYGYPIFNFYNPLPYYFGSLFMFFGLDALLAAKMMFIFPIILSGLTMYLFSKLLLPRWGAALAAVLYLYAPYHGVQIYVRGAVAEYWAYAVLPLVFWTIWNKMIILGGLALATLITSHNLTAFMSVSFILMSPIFFNKKIVGTSEPRSRETMTHGRRPWEWRVYYWGPFLITIILGLGLSAFFWLPALAETGKTQVSQMVFENFDPPAKHLITISQLWTSPWGYGGSSPGTDDGLSLQLGKVHLLGSLAAIVILLYCYITKRKKIQLTIEQSNNLAIFFAISLIASIYLLLPYSTVIWNSISLLSYIQFPWRFLTFASLFSSILAAWAIWKTINITSSRGRAMLGRGDLRDCHVVPTNVGTPRNDNKNYFLIIVFCFLLIAFSIKFFQPQFKYPTSAAQLTSRERILWEVSRRSDEYLPIGFIRPITLEETLRVNNPANQILADELKKPTPVRKLGNVISVLTAMGMIGYTLSRHSQRSQ